MEIEPIKIRPANSGDFLELYKIGKGTKEFQVSASGEFMDEDEFAFAMSSNSSVFLVAEENKKILGFIYASSDDSDKPLKKRWACLVYLVVLPEERGKGIATKLYEKCVSRLKEMNINHLYGWANVEGDGAILKFMKHEGFSEGHNYKWMDKAI